MKKVRWGVIGAGGIADRRTIPEGIMTADNAELIAVQDVVEDRAKAVGEKYGVEYCTNEDQLFRPNDIDAVYIASPSHLHSEHVYGALNAGKHVLCEKPLGITVAQCRSMVGQARTAGLKLGVNFMMRFHDAHQQLMQEASDGNLGQLVMGKAELSCWYPLIPGAFRQDPELGGGGAFIDMASHCVDMLEQYFGPVATVIGTKSNLVQKYKSEDTAAALLEFASGAIGVVTALFNTPDDTAKNELVLYGTKGRASGLIIGQASTGKMDMFYSDQSEYDASQQRPANVETGVIVAEDVNMYSAHIEAFSRAVLENTEEPIPGEAGLHSAEVMAAFYAACRDGRAVAV